MINSIETQIILIIICLLFSAFFSGLEIAYISRDKLNFEIKSKSKSLFGKIFSTLNRNSSEFIATMLIGNNLSLVMYGLIMTQFLEPMLSFINSDITILIIQTLLSTIVVLITAEYIPKSIFLINPDKLLVTFSIPLFIIYKIFNPLVKAIMVFSKWFIINILQQKYSDEKVVFKLTDLNDYIKKVVVSDKEIQSKNVTEFINNALSLKTVKVRDCMIPRTDIISIDKNDSILELNKIIDESGFSKIIVYKSSIDQIIGYCHGLSLFKKPKRLKEIIKPITFINETNFASEILFKFISEQISIAVVIDEYGGTSGILTLEDIIEEIFGEIIDEFDEDLLLENKIDKNSYNFSARLEIDYLNQKYNFKIPRGEYDTLGGFILDFNKNLPKKDDEIEFDKFFIKILSMNDNRIDNVFFKQNTK
jgi:CBS domain containing-hemolysin-like protein|tara:strand:- start:10322 stop:11584 length:1263 start_codon:yes stop_codon:yes gene_type:complete